MPGRLIFCPLSQPISSLFLFGTSAVISKRSRQLRLAIAPERTLAQMNRQQ